MAGPGDPLGPDHPFANRAQFGHRRLGSGVAGVDPNRAGSVATSDPLSISFTPEYVAGGFYYWSTDEPGYVSWLEHASLPKLNYNAPALAARMVQGRDSVIGRWLAPPFALDGWRIDVANMTGRHADDDLRLQAHHSAWPTYLHRGEPAAAREHAAAGRRLYDPERHRSHRLLFGGHDPGVCARMFYGLAHWVLGYPEQALAGAGDGLR